MHEARDELAAFANLPAGARLNAHGELPAYFRSLDQVISVQVRSPSNSPEWFAAQTVRIDAALPIGIHVRWGDYLKVKHVSGTVPPDFNRGGPRSCRMAGRSRHVRLLSNDPEGDAKYLIGAVSTENVVQPPIGDVLHRSLSRREVFQRCSLTQFSPIAPGRGRIQFSPTTLNKSDEATAQRETEKQWQRSV